jgi:hypothetical protein
MSAADVGARVYRVLGIEVYTATGMAHAAFAESILDGMTGTKPNIRNLLRKIL